MAGRDWEIEEGKEVVGKTIVGGRPRARRTRKLRIPIGIEKLLCRAAADGELKRGLLYDRTNVLKAPGLELSDDERAILASIPALTLETMIDRIDLQRHPKRTFMKGVVAAAVLAAATTLVDCGGESQPAGIQPDDWNTGNDAIEEMVPEAIVQGIEPDDVYTAPDPDVVEMIDTVATKGIAPDLIDTDDMSAPVGIQPDVVETEDMMAPTGIMPDVVETEEVAVDTGIGPDVVDHQDAMAGTGILPDVE